MHALVGAKDVDVDTALGGCGGREQRVAAVVTGTCQHQHTSWIVLGDHLGERCYRPPHERHTLSQ